MNFDEAALVREILREPTADAPRLALADRLDVRGDPRAELIRVQVKIAEIRRANDVSVRAWMDLAKRADALIERYGRLWSASVPTHARDPVFHRGFVEEVTLEAAQFSWTADELYAAAPILRLRLENAGRAIDRLFSSPALDRIIALDLRHGGLGDDGARRVAESTHLEHLVWLDLGFNDIGMDGLEALAASYRLPRLGWLGFAGNRALEPGEGFGVEGGEIVSTGPSPTSTYLEAKYGSRAWLHAPSLHTYAYPPDPDDLLGSK